MKPEKLKNVLITLAHASGLPLPDALSLTKSTMPLGRKPFSGTSDAASALASALFQKIRDMDNGADRWRANAALWNQRAVKAYHADPEHFHEWADKPRYDNFRIAYEGYFTTFKSLWELVRSAGQEDEYIYWYFSPFSRELIEAHWRQCEHAAYPDMDPGYDPDAWEAGNYPELNF